MGLFNFFSLGKSNSSKPPRRFSGKNKSEVSSGLRGGSSECGRKMRDWRKQIEKKNTKK